METVFVYVNSAFGDVEVVSTILDLVFYCTFYFSRVPCRSGMCSTPLHVTSSQLIASEIFPAALVKALLYPGAAANSIVKDMTLPSWDSLLNIYNLTSVKDASAVTDLQRLEVHFLHWLLLNLCSEELKKISFRITKNFNACNHLSSSYLK